MEYVMYLPSDLFPNVFRGFFYEVIFYLIVTLAIHFATCLSHMDFIYQTFSFERISKFQEAEHLTNKLQSIK